MARAAAIKLDGRLQLPGQTGELCSSMDYEAFTNDSLVMMYSAVRGALAADDEYTSDGKEPRFRVRQTPAWQQHAADLEAEMLRRGMVFDMIRW